MPIEIKTTVAAPGNFGSKGYFGLPLPLIPDIRATEVKEGTVGKLLEVFGVRKKYERQVELQKGPNRKANKYLLYQYNRLIKSLEGVKVQGNSSTPAKVI
jgi:hypothetical protein